MTAIFVPIEEFYPTGSSLICSGATADFGDALGTANPLDLAEMAGPAEAGRILACETGRRGLFVKAEVTGRVAMSKVTEHVYRGFGVVMALDRDGGAVVQRVALVDAPDAATLAKRSGPAPAWAALNIEKGLKLSIPTTAKRAAAIASPQIKIMEPPDLKAAQSDRLQKERKNESDAIAVIRSALRAPIGGTDTEVIRGLYNRR